MLFFVRFSYFCCLFSVLVSMVFEFIFFLLSVFDLVLCVVSSVSFSLFVSFLMIFFLCSFEFRFFLFLLGVILSSF